MRWPNAFPGRCAGFETSGLVAELLPGDNWAAILGQGLETADWCVFVLTPGSADVSPRQKADLQFVMAGDRFRDRVIPVAFGGQSADADGFPWVLRDVASYRSVETNDAEAATREIVDIIEHAGVATV